MESDPYSEPYKLRKRDLPLLKAAAELLQKLICTSAVSPAEIMSAARLLHAISHIPHPLTADYLRVEVCSPDKHFGEIRTSHS
jgi:hypothetical protein